MHRARKLVLIVAVAAIVSSCGGSQVTVKDLQIPDPLIDKLPMKVAGRYPEEFRHYTHEETIAGKEKWTIDLGQSNQLLFSELFNSMFADYRVIGKETDPRDLGLDAVIEPSIDAFEFSVPNQTQTEEFAVWIRYRIKIYDSEGNQVANWPISAYGKSQKGKFGGDSALQRAAVLAMRDAAALMIMQMDHATGISKLNAASDGPEDSAPSANPELQEDQMPATTIVEGASDDQG